jgi:cell division septation protein DedD
MNRKNLQSWHATLGPVQIVVLLGVIMGSMACAFYLGYFSGRGAGFDEALAANLSNAVKLPVPETAGAPLDEQALSDVYAKLSDSHTGSVHTGALKAEAKAEAEKSSEKTEALGSEAAFNAASVSKEVEEQGLAGANEVSEETNSVAKEEKTAKIAAGEKEPIAAAALPQPEMLPEDEAPPRVAKLISKESFSAANEIELPEAPSTEESDRPKSKESKPPAGKTAEKSSVSEAQRRLAPSSNIPRGWFAQIAAPRKFKDAERLGEQLKKNGFQVMVENTQVRGEQYYRVLVGPEEGRKQAERLVSQLRRESYIRGEPFIRYIR